jgi:hypothetical protein
VRPSADIRTYVGILASASQTLGVDERREPKFEHLTSGNKEAVAASVVAPEKPRFHELFKHDLAII